MVDNPAQAGISGAHSLGSTSTRSLATPIPMCDGYSPMTESCATAPRLRRRSPTRAAADLGSSEDLSELLWSFAPPPRPRPVDGSEIPSVSTESKAMSRELKRRGFRFVGPTTAYALMQATGMVDDHIQACWVPTERPFDQPGCPMAAR